MAALHARIMPLEERDPRCRWARLTVQRAQASDSIAEELEASGHASGADASQHSASSPSGGTPKRSPKTSVSPVPGRAAPVPPRSASPSAASVGSNVYSDSFVADSASQSMLAADSHDAHAEDFASRVSGAASPSHRPPSPPVGAGKTGPAGGKGSPAAVPSHERAASPAAVAAAVTAVMPGEESIGGDSIGKTEPCLAMRVRGVLCLLSAAGQGDTDVACLFEPSQRQKCRPRSARTVPMRSAGRSLRLPRRKGGQPVPKESKGRAMKRRRTLSRSCTTRCRSRSRRTMALARRTQKGAAVAAAAAAAAAAIRCRTCPRRWSRE